MQSKANREALHDAENISKELTGKMPAQFQLGDAIGEGDCFFDAIAQALNLRCGKETHDIKSLRRACDDYIKKSKQTWVKNTVTKDGDDYYQYLTRISLTATEIEIMKYENGLELGPAVWGRPAIEGRMICDMFNVKLHIIEVNEEIVGGSQVMEQLIDAQGAKSIEDMPPEAYNDEEIIHLVVHRHHFVPLLKINKDNKDKFETTQQSSRAVTFEDIPLDIVGGQILTKLTWLNLVNFAGVSKRYNKFLMYSEDFWKYVPKKLFADSWPTVSPGQSALKVYKDYYEADRLEKFASDPRWQSTVVLTMPDLITAANKELEVKILQCADVGVNRLFNWFNKNIISGKDKAKDIDEIIKIGILNLLLTADSSKLNKYKESIERIFNHILKLANPYQSSDSILTLIWQFIPLAFAAALANKGTREGVKLLVEILDKYKFKDLEDDVRCDAFNKLITLVANRKLYYIFRYYIQDQDSFNKVAAILGFRTDRFDIWRWAGFLEFLTAVNPKSFEYYIEYTQQRVLEDLFNDIILSVFATFGKLCEHVGDPRFMEKTVSSLFPSLTRITQAALDQGYAEFEADKSRGYAVFSLLNIIFDGSYQKRLDDFIAMRVSINGAKQLKLIQSNCRLLFGQVESLVKYIFDSLYGSHNEVNKNNQKIMDSINYVIKEYAHRKEDVDKLFQVFPKALILECLNSLKKDELKADVVELLGQVAAEQKSQKIVAKTSAKQLPFFDFNKKTVLDPTITKAELKEENAALRQLLEKNNIQVKTHRKRCSM